MHRVHLYMASSLCALLLAAMLPLSTKAQMTPIDFSVRDANTLHALVLPEGLFLNAGTDVLYACSESFGDANAVLWTGRPEHVVLHGADGVWLSTESGCHWRRTSGAVDAQGVVGHYQPTEGGDHVVFAIDDPLGKTAVVETLDGGFTSTLSGALAVSEVRFIGMAGESGEVAIAGRDAEGMLHLWWSSDSGEVFEPVEGLSTSLGEDVRSLGFALGRLWLIEGQDLRGVSKDAQVSVDTLTFSPQGFIAGADDQSLWLAAGQSGLWRKAAEGGWMRVQDEDTRVVKSALGHLWIARSVERAGAPVVLRSDDAGSSWWPIWSAPDVWRFPATCKSSEAQRCEESTIALRESLGLEVEAPPPPMEDADPPALEEGCTGGRSPAGLAVFSLLLLLLSSTYLREVPRSP